MVCFTRALAAAAVIVLGAQGRPHLHPRAFSIQPDGRLWPNSTVTYKYATKNDANLLSSHVDDAIAAWKKSVPCLQFRRVSDGPVENNSSSITISANNKTDCASTVAITPMATLSMTLDPDACFVPGIMHELGHVLGLSHENQRPDAPKFITFHCENVLGYPWGVSNATADATCCKTGQHTDGNDCGDLVSNFLPAAETDLWNQNGNSDISAAYDTASIMQYPATAFGKPGYTTLEGAPEQSATVLSKGDIARVTELYCKPLKPVKPVQPVDTLPVVPTPKPQVLTEMDRVLRLLRSVAQGVRREI